MILYSLMIVSVIFNVLKSMLQNSYVKNMQRDNTDCLIFNLILSISSLLTILINSGFQLTVSKELLFFGILLGLFSALSYYYMAQALITGSMSYTVFIASTAMLVPIIAGTFVWKDPISLVQILGILTLLFSFYLGINFSKKEKISGKWIIACIIMFISSGMIGVLQKLQQLSPVKEETDSFLVLGFIFASLFMSIPVLSSKDRRNLITFGTKPYIYAFGSGIAYGIINILNLYLVGNMASSVFFPAYNGGVILTTTIAGALFFKEKLTTRQYISILVGIVGIVLVNI